MNRIFLQAVNASFAAGYLTLIILLIRYLFPRFPKWLSITLWALVAVRLMLPVTIQSEISLLPSSETFEMNLLDEGNGDYYINTGIDMIDDPINDYMGDKYYEGVTVRYNFKRDLTTFLAKMWIIGITLMLSYAIVSYIRLKSMLATATRFKDNIHHSEFVKSPFVLGIFSPKIYIPYEISEEEMQFVISHEKMHIKRKDHLSKIFAYILLSIYWFNPMMWLAYSVFCKDLELACDEAVIKNFDISQKQAYSNTLLSFGMRRAVFSACPLAFGEEGLKERIKGIMNYKKPTTKILILSAAVIILFTVFFMTSPPPMGLEDIDVWTERLYENVDHIYAVSPQSEYLLTDAESIQNAIEALRKIQLNKQEVSKSLDEDRPKDYMIDLGSSCLYFNEGLNNVWIDNFVKPTFTYRIKNPDYVRETFFEPYFTGSVITNRLKGEIVSMFYDGNILRYELRNNLGEYFGIIITPQTTLSFTSEDDRFIIEDITGGILWDGIYPGAYIDVTPVYNDDLSEPGSQMFSESYEWIDAKEYYVAEKVTVTGFDKNYFLSDGE